MKLFRFQTPSGPHLGLEQQGGRRVDLTVAAPDAFGSLGAWLAAPDPIGAVLAVGPRASTLVPDEVEPLAPVDEQEVWAAGVTYERSRVARREESPTGGDFYDRIYEADRPELFFKALAHRVVGSGGAIRVRADSKWNVPEPELALVLTPSGRIVGYTIGNDVSSRSIEGENPLYLPQAKVYDGACAVGPAIVLAQPGALDPRAVAIRLHIRRDGGEAFVGETSTTRMRRSPEDLASWLVRELSFTRGAVLLTGTGIVPPESFSLQRGDVVEITIEGVGTLVNTVA